MEKPQLNSKFIHSMECMTILRSEEEMFKEQGDEFDALKPVEILHLEYTDSKNMRGLAVFLTYENEEVPFIFNIINDPSVGIYNPDVEYSDPLGQRDLDLWDEYKKRMGITKTNAQSSFIRALQDAEVYKMGWVEIIDLPASLPEKDIQPLVKEGIVNIRHEDDGRKKYRISKHGMAYLI